MDEPPETLDAAPLPLSLAEAERIIALLEDVVRERSVVLIGGQAVAIWTAYLQSRLTDDTRGSTSAAAFVAASARRARVSRFARPDRFPTRRLSRDFGSTRAVAVSYCEIWPRAIGGHVSQHPQAGRGGQTCH